MVFMNRFVIDFLLVPLAMAVPMALAQTSLRKMPRQKAC